MRISLPAVLAVLLLASGAVAQYTGYERPPLGAQDYTEIRARVLNVGIMTFPYARLTLDILYSTNSSIFDYSQNAHVIVVDNYFWRTLGRVDCTDRRNVGSLGAYYLLQGDEIHAKLFSGTGWGSQWYVYGVMREAYGRALYAQSVQEYDGLTLTLSIVPKYYEYGEPVPLTLTVRNTANTVRVLEFSSSKHYDFVVTYNGLEVWRWSRNKAFAQVATRVSLVPGESLTFNETWRQQDNNGRQVGAGEYQANGILTTSGASQPSAGQVRITVFSRTREGTSY